MPDVDLNSLRKDALVLEYAVFGQLLHLYAFYVNPTSTGHADTLFFDLFKGLMFVTGGVIVTAMFLPRTGEVATLLLRARIFLDIVLVVSSIAFRLSLTTTSLHVTEWLVVRVPYLQSLGVWLVKKILDSVFSASVGGIAWEWFRRRWRQIRRSRSAADRAAKEQIEARA